MTVPTHFKLTFRGTFVETPEIWSFGVKFNREVTLGDDADLSEIDDAAVTSAIDALLGNSGAATFNANVKCTDWRAYIIGTDGKMQGNPKVVDVSAGTVAGTGGAAFPPQIALVVTTVADNRGPARFGRFYLPGPSAALASGMRISETVAGDYAEAATTFLKAVSGAIDLPGTTDSSAAVNISDRPSPDGTRQDVDHVEVGRVYDTLRTRRNAMLEERHVHGQIDW